MRPFKTSFIIRKSKISPHKRYYHIWFFCHLHFCQPLQWDVVLLEAVANLPFLYTDRLLCSSNWRKFVHRSRSDNFSWNDKSFDCCLHCSGDQFSNLEKWSSGLNHRLMLKDDAVPTIIHPHLNSLKDILVKAKGWKLAILLYQIHTCSWSLIVYMNRMYIINTSY